MAVLGCGAVGLLLVQLARLSGAGTIVAIDPLPYRTKLALELGATVACQTFTEVAEATGRRGADLVLEATDASTGFDHAVRATRIGGCVVLVGIPEGNEYVLNAAEARRRGLSIKFSRRMPEIYPRAIALAASGRVKLRPLATHHFGLTRPRQLSNSRRRVGTALSRQSSIRNAETATGRPRSPR